MNRENKFRGRSKNTGEWVYGDLLHVGGGCLIYFGSQTEVETPYIENGSPIAVELFKTEIAVVDPNTVGQFTGKQDVKKNDIYQGDILKITKYGRTFMAVARWNKDYTSWCLQLCGEKHIGCKTLGDWLRYDILEVVGNIHDNPLLLKGGEE